jgi:Ca2+-binding EF-hand superfamily protein
MLAAMGEDLVRPEMLEKAFRCFDIDHTGVVTKDNLKIILGEALAKWVEFEDDILSQLLVEAASDSDEGITYDDFLRLMYS